MPDNDTALELYGRGISAHDLCRSYVEDRLDDVPYASHSRRELSEYAKEDEVFRIYFLPRALHLLDRVESQIINGLLSGDIVALGYADPRDLTLESVPSQQWNFLNLDFEKGAATGTDLHYAGLRFLRKDDLTADQIQAITLSKDQPQVPQPQVKGIGAALNFQATDWKDITLRFLKDSFVAVGIDGQEKRMSLGELSLLNRTTGQPNKGCAVLLKMANGQRVSRESRHTVSDLRRLLKDQFGLSSDPFQLEGQRGYRPNFHLVDDRDAADRRAKEKAKMVPYQKIEEDRNEHDEGLFDTPPTGDYQDEYLYEEDLETKDDEASAFIRERTGG